MTMCNGQYIEMKKEIENDSIYLFDYFCSDSLIYYAKGTQIIYFKVGYKFKTMTEFF